jgi:hypothetical protein
MSDATPSVGAYALAAEAEMIDAMERDTDASR